MEQTVKMKKINITINDLKTIKSLHTELVNLQEENYRRLNDFGGSDYNGKESLIESKERIFTKEVLTVAEILNLDYNTVVDMIHDFEFATYVLNDIYKAA